MRIASVSLLGMAVALLLVADARAASIFYVDHAAGGANDGKSWANAFTELQSAMSVAKSGDQVWVAAGTYRPDYDASTRTHTGNIDASFGLVAGVKMYGGFPAGGSSWANRRPGNSATETILSGDLAGDDRDDFGEAILCYSGSGVALLPGCELFDEDDDNDVDLQDLHLTDNSKHVVKGTVAANAGLDGFTISGGNANYSYPDSQGGGIYGITADWTVANCRLMGNAAAVGGAMAFIFTSSPTLRNCVIEFNLAWAGGGLYANGDGTPLIEDCSFTGNLALSYGGGADLIGHNPTFRRCLFTHNRSRDDGGGMGLNDRTVYPLIEQCQFIANVAQGSGGAFYGYTRARFHGCRFMGNLAEEHGGAVSNASQASAINCLFVGNAAAEGGAWYKDYSDESNTIFMGCTIAGNKADRGGWLYLCYASASLTNSVTWGNSCTGVGCQIYREGNYSLLSHSNIREDDGGADPRFVREPNPGPDGQWDGVDDDYGDLSLRHDSPCIDAGDSAYVPLDTDVAGKPRRVDDGSIPDTGHPPVPVVDIGAYEWQGDCNGNHVPDETEPDSDHDGVIDDCESCPLDPLKVQPGICGCGVPDSSVDTDTDGVVDCVDNCVLVKNRAQSDNDGDGIGDACDSCPYTPPGTPVNANGCPPFVPADFDHDEDVDHADFISFDSCYSGPAIPYAEGCGTRDFDRDGDIDQNDLGFFQRCYSGNNIPSNRTCADWTP